MKGKRYTEEQIIRILRKIVAQQAIDIDLLRDISSKNW